MFPIHVGIIVVISSFDAKYGQFTCVTCRNVEHQQEWHILYAANSRLIFRIKTIESTKEDFIEHIRENHPLDFEFLMLWHSEIFEGKYYR